MIDEIKESTGDEKECPICGDELVDCGIYEECCDCGYIVYKEEEEDDDDALALVSEV